jgi:hypothetical protein
MLSTKVKVANGSVTAVKLPDAADDSDVARRA